MLPLHLNFSWPLGHKRKPEIKLAIYIARYNSSDKQK
eukprot:02206.XXX_44941_45051_1 [CDS] Oithona nana genome sequencing.